METIDRSQEILEDSQDVTTKYHCIEPAETIEICEDFCEEMPLSDLKIMKDINFLFQIWSDKIDNIWREFYLNENAVQEFVLEFKEDVEEFLEMALPYDLQNKHQIEALQDQFDCLKRKNDELKKNVKMLNAKNEGLKLKIGGLEGDLEEVRGQNDGLIERVCELEDEIQIFQSEISTKEEIDYSVTQFSILSELNQAITKDPRNHKKELQISEVSEDPLKPAHKAPTQGISQQVESFDNNHFLIAKRSQNSFISIRKNSKELKLIENGNQLFSKTLKVKKSKDTLRDVLYLPKTNCYLILVGNLLLRKNVDKKAPEPLHQGKSCYRFGPRLRYSHQKNALFAFRDIISLKPMRKGGLGICSRKITFCALRLFEEAQMVTEFEIEVTHLISSSSVLDFEVFGENQNRTIFVAKNGVVFLGSLDWAESHKSVINQRKVRLCGGLPLQLQPSLRILASSDAEHCFVMYRLMDHQNKVCKRAMRDGGVPLGDDLTENLKYSELTSVDSLKHFGCNITLLGFDGGTGKKAVVEDQEDYRGKENSQTLIGEIKDVNAVEKKANILQVRSEGLNPRRFADYRGMSSEILVTDPSKKNKKKNREKKSFFSKFFK